MLLPDPSMASKATRAGARENGRRVRSRSKDAPRSGCASVEFPVGTARIATGRAHPATLAALAFGIDVPEDEAAQEREGPGHAAVKAHEEGLSSRGGELLRRE